MLTWDDIEKFDKLLHEDRYDSKDWKAGNAVERIEWLISMYESKKEELENAYEMLDKLGE